MKDLQHKYNVWRTDSHCAPIEGTDKYYWGKSARWVMQHVAYELGIKLEVGGLVIRMPDGDMYFCQRV